MSCEQKSTKQETTGCACPCAKMCSNKALLLAVAAVPLAFWAVTKLRK
jgi:hypothetical protein